MPTILGLDLGRTIFAFSLAVLLYFFALAEVDPEREGVLPFTVPVEVVNRPSRLVLSDPRPPEVGLRVRAREEVLNRLRPESFQAQIDAAGAVQGENILPVTVISRDPDVRSVRPVPDAVTLVFEEIRERTIPVVVNVVGQVPPGYQLGTPRVEPARVTISGRSSVVPRATQALVDINVDRATVTVNGSFTPRVVDERGVELRELNVEPPSVNVTVPVTQQAQFKAVGVRTVIIGHPATGYFLEPVEVEPSGVTLVGQPGALQGANFVETEPIDVDGLSSTSVRRVQLVPPPDTLLLEGAQTADVTLRVSPLQVTRTISVEPVVVNVGRGLVLTSQEQPVEITLSGPAPTLTSLTARDLRVVLDVSGRGPGRYLVPVAVQNLPEGMTLDRVEPGQLEVELRALPPTPTPTPFPTLPATFLSTPIPSVTATPAP